MAPDPTLTAAIDSRSEAMLRRLMGGMSIFTLLMTIPQVLTIWIGQQAAGVSVLSWSAILPLRSSGFGSESGSATRTVVYE